jgi:nitrite reductase/ring-hydroxylating ferredoxin subunit
MSKIFSRRDFLDLLKKLFAATGLAALLGPTVAYFFPPNLEETPSEPVFVSAEEELPIGESKTVKFGRYPAIVINTKNGLKAYSAVCTHFACIVMWNLELNQIVCPCHDGFFNVDDGSVISGPPPSGLEPFKITHINGDIYVEAGDQE